MKKYHPNAGKAKKEEANAEPKEKSFDELIAEAKQLEIPTEDISNTPADINELKADI